MPTHPGKSSASATQPRVVELLQNPLVAGAGSAGIVFLLGSLVLITVWAFSGSGDTTVAAASNRNGEESVNAGPGPKAGDALARDSAPSSAPPVTSAANDSSDSAIGTSPSPSPANAAASATKIDGASQLDAFHRVSLPPLQIESRRARDYAEGNLDPTHFSLDTSSGTLAVVGLWKREVGFITNQQLVDGATADDIATVKLPGTPASVEYKPLPDGGVFLVGYGEPAGIAFIDPSTLEILKRIPSEGTSVGTITCALDPNATEAFAFYYNNHSHVLKLNTHEMSVDATWSTDTGGLVSPDGKTVFTQKHGPIEPTEVHTSWVNIVQVMERQQNQQQTFKIEPARFKFHLEPRGRFVTCGREVYPPEWDHKLTAFEFEASAFSTAHPWAAGIGRDEFVVGSTNSGKVLRRLKTPIAWRPEKYRPDPKRDPRNLREGYYSGYHDNKPKLWSQLLDCQVFADDKHNRFILAHSGNVFCIPYADLDLPEEPDLWLNSSPPDMGYVGKSLQFEMQTPTEGVTLELLNQLDDARIEGQTFHWTPSSKGKATFVAKISKGNATHTATWSIDVDLTTTPKLDIPFYVMHADVSVDGTKMAITGYSKAPDRSGAKPDNPPKMAVIDLATKQIVVQKDIAFDRWGVVFCANEILVPKNRTSSDPPHIVRLKASDLSIAGQENTDLGTIVSLADRVVAVGDRYYLSVPELKQITFPRSSGDRDRDGKRLADGWTYRGVLWDRPMKKPKLLYSSSPFSLLYYQQRPQTSVKHVYAGFVLDQPTTMDSNRRIDRETRRDCDVLPADVQLEQNNDYTKVNFLDTVHGELRHEAILETRKSRGGFSRSSSDTPRKVVGWSSQEMFAVYAGNLYVIDLAPIRSKFPRPFHIVPEQSTFVLKGRNPKVSYRAEGATNFTLEITDFSDGPSTPIESADGNFPLETPDPAEMAKIVWERISPQGRGNPVENLKQYLENVTPLYQTITGRKPSGVPIAVTAYVTATGSNLETAVLQHHYLIDVSRSMIQRNMPANPTGPTTRRRR